MKNLLIRKLFELFELFDKQVGTPTLPTAILLKSSSSMRATLVFNLFFK
jgi:hypothetical protein